MYPANIRMTSIVRPLQRVMAALCAVLFVAAAQAAAPGIKNTRISPNATSTAFDLTAAPAYITQPDGASIYSWGYGCASGSTPTFAPAAIGGANCPTMQIPGPTLIVTENQTVTVTLTNNLPAAAGNTSILFPGFTVTSSGGTPGVLTQEAPIGGSVTYQFKATNPGTHTYYSGTQGDLQIEMGLYGVIIVLPAHVPANCAGNTPNTQAKTANGESDFRLASAAYDHAATCYDREYLFQFSEMDPAIHSQADEQKDLQCARPTGCMTIATEPYHPAYFLINGRSMPDLMDPNYVSQYPHQPYNGNPHMHPGELVLLRVAGTGRWQHPFHEHGNHVRVLGRDGNLLLSQTDPTKLAGPLLFTTTTTPGITLDGIYYWTGKGLNWDVYGHYAGDGSVCVPDANGYYTLKADGSSAAGEPNYYEWCQDHAKALEAHPFGSVASGGPVTLPDPNILANGAWYGGSPYLGPDATARAVGTTPIPPSGTVGNSPTEEAGFAYMWHSHNEREITTNNAFPGGAMMMMLVDPRAYKIDEAN